jgi:hypothetical protein
MTKSRSLLFLLTSFALFVPVNIYSTGSGAWTANGIQWGLVRFQHSVFGDQVISFSTDLSSALSAGIVSWCGSASVLIWSGAVFLLIAALILNIIALWLRKDTYAKQAAGLTFLAGLGFLAADIATYGFFLHGGSVWCLPIGIPAILILGIWGLRMDFGSGSSQKSASPSVVTPVMESETVISHFRTLLHDHEVIALIIISLLVKAVVVCAGILPNISFTVITGDLTLYHWYAAAVFSGHVPYGDYYIPYPQLFLVPVFVALIPAASPDNVVGYLYSFSGFMILCDIATMICVYSLAERFFGKEKAFLCGLLYATAIGAAFFVPITFDALPTFLMVFSLWLFLSRREVASCLAATVSMLMKWFGVFCFPYFLIYTHKNKGSTRDLKKPLLISVLFSIVVVVPFVIMNLAGFLRTYQSPFYPARGNSQSYLLSGYGFLVCFSHPPV